MNFNTALDIKKAISGNFLTKSIPSARVITFASAASPASSRVQNDILQKVNGVGVGEKQNGGNFVKVLVRENSDLTPGRLSRHFNVNAEDIRIHTTGPIRFRFPMNNHRPPYPGISVGHYKITAGTLGCFVQDDKKRTYILSNNHVLANNNRAKLNDIILQPGKLDGGKKKLDVIAMLSDFEPINIAGDNAMDAAIAEIIEELNPVYKVNQQHKIKGKVLPKNGMRVEKFGRTTGHTKGRVTTRNIDLKVEFGNRNVEFLDQFEVKAYKGMFCDGGDSGSLIFESQTLKAVGLLFAGSDDGTTFASPITDVLNRFSVKIM